MTYTIRVCNPLLGTEKFRETCATLDEAIAWARKEANRCQPFMRFEIWTGTSKKPDRATEHTIRRES